ncbi:MAG TPA: gliding motility-associated C-terminal domain-containing protein [Chitinophagales bacterium]|nr:gliding motility-associated C-terminal domain-containing protein [Chitinophagales bacterium]
MIKLYSRVLPVLAVCLSALSAIAQTYSDGPIQLQVRLRDVKIQYDNTNRRDAVSLSVGNFNLPGSLSGDEFTYNFTIGDNAVQAPPASTGCLQADLAITSGTDYSVDHNQVVFNYTYPGATVPQFFTLGIDAHEDDIPTDFAVISGLTSCGTNGSRCTYQASSCCANVPFIGCLFSEEDDYRLLAPNYKTDLNYRLGPPCEWYDHGYVNGTASTFDFYHPRLESYWRYTGGTSCANAIDLGTLTNGGTALTHYNSNRCYSNNFTTSAGNDVFYKFRVNSPIGATISLCGVNGAQFNSVLYLLNSSCTAIDNNDDGCGNQSVINKSICVPGDYYIVVDAATAGDLGTFTLTVTENPTFTFSTTITPTAVSCFGQTDGQALAVVNGGTPNFTYAWSNSTSVNPATGLAGGPISVTVSDANGCQASASATISVPAQIGLTTTTTPVSCGGSNNGTATANATGGTTPYNYLWNSAPPQTFQTATLLPTGTYTVTVTDDQGCTVSATANVQSATTIVITVDSVDNVQCNGLNNGGVYITTSGGQTPYTYSWSNGPTTEDNTNLGPGIYSVTITDAISCTLSGTYTITEPPVLTAAVSFTFNPRCNAGTDGIVNITVSGGEQPYSYNWNPTGASTQNLNNVGAGTHSVTVSDASNCTATATATLTEPTPYNVVLTTTDVLCNGGTNGAAQVTVSGQTGPYTYFWSNFATTSSVTALDGGPFSVVIEDANGCDTIVTSTINEPAAIDVQLTPSEPLCADSANGVITTTVTGGTTPFTYSWTGSNNFTSTDQNPQVAAGTYTVLVTDANNCTGTETTSVNTPSPFTVSVLGIDPACIGDSTGAAVSSTAGGTAPYSYSWNVSSVDSAYLENLAPGTYSVTVTDANGCQSSGQATLTEPTTDGPNCADDKFVVLVPTAFSPNGDGRNDMLVAIRTDNVQRLEFSVWNRWGEMVYFNGNMQKTEGWDGTFRGKPQPVGAYIWQFNVNYTNGVRTTERGSASLIR